MRKPIQNKNWKAKCDELKRDQEAVGTGHYKGIAYFWDASPSVKHVLRNANRTMLKKVHAAFLNNNVPFNDVEKFFITTQRANELVYCILKRGGVRPPTNFDWSKLRDYRVRN